MVMARRPRSKIESVILHNEKDESDMWKPTRYMKNSWVLLHPSSKGIFRQKKKAKLTYKSYWKARILEFKTSPGGQSISEVLVQHVYMHSELRIQDFNPHDHRKCNYLYPSSINEWEPAQSLAGILDVIHSDIGKLQYKGRSSKELADNGIFFYESKYTPDIHGGYGKLEAISLPGFDSDEWFTPDNNLAESFRCKLFLDVKNSLKSSTGSKHVRLSWFISLQIFVEFFSSANVRRTPTLFVCKDLSDDVLSNLMDKGWDSKTNGNIECRIKRSSMCFRYHIERQMLSLIFSYQRWKKSGESWLPLDQDFEMEGHTKRKEIEIIYNEELLTIVEVEEHWNLHYIRSELVLLHNDLPEYFRFLINGKLVRKRQEMTTDCKDLPRTIHIVEEH